MDRELADLLARAKRNQAEIEQLFKDCASWNQNVRQPDEPIILADPDGKLREVWDQMQVFIDLHEGKL